MPGAFSGDKKVGQSLLGGLETRFKLWAVPKLPGWIETHHLTLLTVVWSALTVCLGFYARYRLSALWWVSLMIVLQYLSDLFDGELGRQRDTGLVKWGFYMDHFLDYLFLCSLVFVGYMISPKGLEIWYFALLVIVGGFMVNSFLSFAATNAFEIYHFGIGPTETRLAIILINTGIIFFGTARFHLLLPIAVLVCFLALVVNTVQIQKKLWDLDMQAKRQPDGSLPER